MSRAGAEAVVSLAALDLRRTPDHRAELLSQLLLGERVILLGGRPVHGWLRVEGREDRYSGWVRDWGLCRMTPSEASRWSREARGRLTPLFAAATSRPGEGALVLPVFWGARFRLGGRRGGWRGIVLPDGRNAWLPARLVRDARELPPALEKRVKSLLGVPYLWGGRSPAGLDCSGFTQLVLREQGMELPRDAKDQFAVSSALAPREKPRLGDLVFFARPRQAPSHVGIHLRHGTFVHCRGDVHFGSLKPGNALSENDLIPQFVAIRRPHPGTRREPTRVRRGGESA